MSTIQIVGIILLIIIVIAFIHTHITLIKSWNNIKVGDIGSYINENENYVIHHIEVINKDIDFITIEYGYTKETVYKHEYVNRQKIFEWNKK